MTKLVHVTLTCGAHALLVAYKMETLGDIDKFHGMLPSSTVKIMVKRRHIFDEFE